MNEMINICGVEVMTRKAVSILLCIISLISVSLGDVFSEMPQDWPDSGLAPNSTWQTELSYGNGLNGNSYTINFFNINYGSLFEQQHLDKSNCPLEEMRTILRCLAEERRIQEIEQKKNLQLLKQIALT
jgi:hypothetical protein